MKIEKITLNVGAEKPFGALHGSDHHLCLCDGRDDERKQELALNRSNAFTGGHPEKLTEEAEAYFAYAAEHGLTALYTGDFLDFTSEANFDYARALFSGADAFVCAGNHEYSLYVGEAWEDEAYKAPHFGKVLASFPNNNIWYGERIINGVRFVAVDNGYYYILPEQFEKFREACSDAMPVVLLVHNPLYSADILAQMDANGRKPSSPPYLCGCPEEYLRSLNDHRFRQQRPDQTTTDFLAFCNETPNLKAVLAGHLHAKYVTRLDSGIPQIVAGGGYRGDVIEYEFV
ncbi:MAG: metallophosphoesterase [Clostridia bacterium]|nr:metallophosphoesterase [Clostridia bacterium]